MPNSADVARELLRLAADDELVARSLLPIEGVTDAGIGFHAQQAIEKAIKAVLAFQGVEFPYSHDLNGLLGLCKNNGIDVPEDLSEVGRLSVFAVRLRYDASPAARLDRDKALAWAAAAVEWAQGIVGQPEPGQGSATRSEAGQEPVAKDAPEQD
jgi:HEPN domain-containing protein